jgi:cytochrome P450
MTRNWIGPVSQVKAMDNIDFDHTKLRNDRDLFAWGDYFRARPIEYSTAHGGFWVVSRHEDLLEVLKNPSLFASSGGTTIPAMGQPVPALPTQSDEPNHRHYRAIITPFLTPGAVAEQSGTIRDIVSDLIDTFIERGEADLVAELSQPIPAMVMARAFGFTAAEAQFVAEQFSAIMMAGTIGDVDAQGAAVDKYMAWVRARLAERRAAPGSDLASAIVAAKIDGIPLSDEECEGILWTAAAGAVQSTGHAIGHALYLLAKHPEVRAQLLVDRTLVPVAVEEMLRLQAPTFMMKRTVTQATEIGGVQLRLGDQVLMVFGWANHDGQVFTNPEDFDLHRARNPHLTFGHGIHKCSGMHLARAELALVVEAVLARLPDYQLVSEVRPTLHAGLLWGHDALPVRFTPGHRARSTIPA